MDGPRQCHTKWNKPDRDGEISYDILYMWNLNSNDTNEWTYKTDTQTGWENEHIIAGGRDS